MHVESWITDQITDCVLDWRRKMCGIAFSMIRRKLVDAVFHRGGSLDPNFEDDGQSYLTLIGIAYA
jgi:hypothetical protein